MDAPRVLLIGPAGDPHLARLQQALAEAGAVAHVVDSRHQPAGPTVVFSPTDEVNALGGVPFSDVTGAFVRAIPPRHPAFARADFATEGAQSRSALEDMRVAEAEGGALRDAVCSALELLWSRGVPVLNPPVAGTYEQQKPYQLSVARRAGFLLPRTLLTNDPEVAAAFVDELDKGGRECVAKPVRGGAHATLVKPGDERIPRVRRAPVILQERAAGADVRVLLLDGEVLAAARLEGTDAVDYRADPRYQRGEARYVEIEVDVEVRRGLHSVQTGLGIPFGGADLRFDEKKGWTFLEMNAAPAFLELEERTGRPVTSALVERLLREQD